MSAPEPRDLLPLGVRRLLPLVVITLLAIVAMLIGFRLGSRPLDPPKRRLQVSVLNVGLGEAAWIRTPSGRVILVGGGPPGTGETVVKALRSEGVREIDLLILPYTYAEAVGGIPSVLEQIPVGTVLETGQPPVNREQEEVQRLLADKGISVQVARAGGKVDYGDVYLEILAPAEPPIAADPATANNSVVFRLVYGETAFLFAGGLEAAGEAALLERAPNMSADWLRVARFGSRTVTSSEFLRRVQPMAAVISVAPGNPSGFPHRETLERLDAAGVRLYRTDRPEDPLTFFSDGSRISTS